MEKNNVEELLEQEMDLVVETSEPQMKEFEKLLIAERDRKDYQKAINLIKFGCFTQTEKEAIDFNELTKVNAKKFKGHYELYRHNETFDLYYIAELVEDNKGDVDERTDLKPYAYDVIEIESMDEETYNPIHNICKLNKEIR